ncbi:helix-hairpin-helix domain-containing protein, partial [Ruegeria sp. NA]
MTAVTDIKGVGEALGQALVANGFKTAEAIAKATPADLVKVPRIGEARALVLIASAKDAVAAKPPAAKPATRRTAARTPATRRPTARKAAPRKTIAAAAAEKRVEEAARKAAEEKAA